MAAPKTVWGIDIGQCALKALKLRSAGAEIRLEAFDVIEHPKILTQPEVDAEQLVRNALEQFLARNNIADSTVVVAAPGKSGITRFVKLPPVEAKQVPEIVRFEAEQQIPFDINEVIWRWQPFQDPDSPDIEVGIFAMKRPDVSAVLDRFTEAEIDVDIVQMAPLALYNFLAFDEQAGEDGATLLVDIGVDKTDLVVADGPRIWTRTMQRGGNNFTEALVKGFKLSFNKAEKLKRTAATSKYARQIFQAMRPVFAELVQEVQRSIGYYTSLHRDSRFRRVVGLGNGFRLPGLQKYLEQNLGIPVFRVDSYNKLSPSAAVNAPAFTENVLSFAVAYGLALQGLGLTRIRTNLLPSEIAKQRLWAQKRPWFAGAAAALVLACAGIAYSAIRAGNTLLPERSQVLPDVQRVVGKYESLEGNYRNVQGTDKLAEARIGKYMDIVAYNDFWERLHFLVSQAISKVARDQDKMTPERVEELKQKERSKRDVILITRLFKSNDEANVAGLDREYLKANHSGRAARGGGVTASVAPSPDPMMLSSRYMRGRTDGAAPPAARGRPGQETPAPAAPAQKGPAGRGFALYLEGTTPKRGTEATVFLNAVKESLIALSKSKEFSFVDVTAGMIVDPGREGVGEQAEVIDALTGEDARDDTQFVLGWIVRINEQVYTDRGKDTTSAGGEQ